MAVREFTDYKGTVEPATEQREVAAEAVEELPAVERERSDRSTCPECEGQIVAARYDSYCEECGLVISEEHLDHGPTLAEIGKGHNRGAPRLETASPYHADPRGSTFSFSYRDGKGNSLSASQLKLVRRMEKRLRWEGKTTDQWMTDALKDIKSMGRSAGLPSFVWEHATDLFRDALDAGLAGGRMAYESLAAGALIVAAREEGCPQSIDAITPWARTPAERACAGARKVRIGLDRTDKCPPVRPDTVDVVLDALRDHAEEDLLGSTYLKVREIAYHLMELADERSIGPGTPRLTVAASAVYAATKMVEDVQMTRSEIVEPVSAIVETTEGKLSRYNCDLINAYVERHGTDDPTIVLESGNVRLE